MTVLCDALEVSRSGFYAYLKRDGEAIDAAEMELIARVKAIHRSPGGCDGQRAFRFRIGLCSSERMSRVAP